MALKDKTSLRCIPTHNGTLELWVQRVSQFSSEYDNSRWCATMIIGPPKVYPDYGDKPGAWAQGVINDSQFIEVEFEKKLYIEKIDIYETLNAGAVVKVSGCDENDQWVTLWQTDHPTLIQSSRIFSPTLLVKNFYSKAIRIDINCLAAGSWCEIDAVKLVGQMSKTTENYWGNPLSEDLNSLVDNHQFSDVVFDVNGQKIHAHRAILVARSQYFRAMFTNCVKENSVNANEPVIIEEVSATSFESLIRFFYTGTVDSSVNPVELVDLIRVADRFNESKLCNLSCFWISQDLTTDNVTDVYLAATENLPQLVNIQELCIEFMSKNLGEVVQTNSFCNLDKSVMLNLIQRTSSLHLS